MEATYTRIKELRIQFHLSQEYVAHYLGIDCSSFALLEAGYYNMTADNADKLSALFGVSSDVFLLRTKASRKPDLLTRSSKPSDSRDEIEVMNLLRIRNQIRPCLKNAFDSSK